MPKKRTNEKIKCLNFKWIITNRKGVFYADGRANVPNVGRHSLGTKDQGQAMEKLAHLDLCKAVETGRAPASALDARIKSPISLEAGRGLYEEYILRPETLGGTAPSTRKRYAAYFDKFLAFAKKLGIRHWTSVDGNVVAKYLTKLKQEGYSEGTLYGEGSFVKQVLKWLSENEHIAVVKTVQLKLRKPGGGPRNYCYTPIEVKAMVEHCEADPNLHYLRDIIIGLARTGLRIDELIRLRWNNIELQRNFLHITNDVEVGTSTMQTEYRTKNRNNRSLPIHEDLISVLHRLKGKAGQFVFRGPKGGKLKSDVLRVQFKTRVIDKLKERFPKVPGQKGFQDGRFHSFRHYFASAAANSGTSLKVVEKWLGHRDSKMINHYYHLHESESAVQMENLHFQDGVSGDGRQGNPLGNKLSQSRQEQVK